MSHSAKVHLCSELSTNRSRSLDSIQCSVDLFKDVKYLRIYDYCIPHAFPNIITGYNNNLQLYERFLGLEPEDDLDTLFTITIDEGYYDSSELIAALKVQLDAESPNNLTYTVAWNDNVLTITSSSLTFKIVVDTTLSPMSRLLGFTTTESYSASQVGDMYLNILKNDLFITCDMVSDNRINSKRTNIIKKVPIKTNFGTKLISVNEDSFVESNSTTFNDIKLGLIFSDGKAVPMKADWSITLEILFNTP